LQLATDYPHDMNFRLNWDRGYPENFQYIKFLWGGGLLFWIFIRRRHLPYLLLSGVLAYLLLDDANKIHEIIGGQLVMAYPNAGFWGINPQDVAEFLTMVAFGSLILLLLALSWFLSRLPERRDVSPIVLLILCIGFFAVVVDFAHGIVGSSPILDELFRIVEEGGEMISATLLAAWIFCLACRGQITAARDEPEPQGKP
ncbi:MAG: hypothetical protein QF541_23760, partial [Lentisphaeria bacterium]|nr:hypothetical protein [Lentisphaeria bacterium]